MKVATRSWITTASLMSVGAIVAGWTGLCLQERDELDVPLNPFGLKRSPYGEIFAMALQGPINKDFQYGMTGATDEESALIGKEREKNKPGNLLIVVPDPEAQEARPPQPQGMLDRMNAMIEEMRIGHVERTNVLPASDMLKFHLRRKAEDKLRLAYDLDPSHYANYTALHFFLIEGITTRPELKEGAEQLARDTIDYCLAIDYDPRPALTAAAACTHILHIMFNAERLKLDTQYSPDEMDAVIEELDHCIATYEQIAAEWDKTGNWQRISRARFEACQERIHFIVNMRNAAVKTVQRIRDTYAK